jgi:hypothetical protein
MLRAMKRPVECPPDDPLVDHLVASSGLTPSVARRIIDDVLAHHAESVEDYVVRRHRELVTDGIRNAGIFLLIQQEVARRPFRVRPCTVRQIRRMIYG